MDDYRRDLVRLDAMLALVDELETTSDYADKALRRAIRLAQDNVAEKLSRAERHAALANRTEVPSGDA